MSPWERYTHRKVVVLRQDTGVYQAASAMCEREIGSVVVVDGTGHVVGILTDRDIACSIVSESRSSETPISEIMTLQPVVAEEGTPIEGLIRLMEKNGIRRIPIVRPLRHGRARCVGMVSFDDIILDKLAQADQLSRIVQAQIRRVLPGGRVGNIERAQARAENTLNRFYRSIAEITKLKDDSPEVLAEFVLEKLVRRLNATDAAHFIAQLPSLIQEDLLNQPAGPDRSITLQTLIDGIILRFHQEAPGARQILMGFFAALSSHVDFGEMEHLKNQLPEEWKVLLSGAKALESKIA